MRRPITINALNQKRNNKNQNKGRRPRMTGNATNNGTSSRNRNSLLSDISEDKSRRNAVVVSDRSTLAIFEPYIPVLNTATYRRLIYYDFGNVSTASGVLQTYVFSCNGMFDPNITGVGHQPVGFDQLMVFYDHYVVRASKISVTFLNQSAGSVPCVGLALNSTNTAPSDFTVLVESGSVVRDRLGISSTPESMKTLELAVDISKFHGTPGLRDNPDLWGTISTNPNDQTYFNLCSWDPQGVSATISFTVSIEFEAWFLEPRKISSSLSNNLHKLLLSESKQQKR